MYSCVSLTLYLFVAGDSKLTGCQITNILCPDNTNSSEIRYCLYILCSILNRFRYQLFYFSVYNNIKVHFTMKINTKHGWFLYDGLGDLLPIKSVEVSKLTKAK